MIAHTAEIIDVDGLLNSGLAVEHFIPLRNNECWLVRRTPIELGNPSHTDKDWVVSRMGDAVRIPLLPYLIGGTMMEHVLIAVMTLQQEITEYYKSLVGQEIQQTHTLVGTPIRRLDGEGKIRMWLGFALRTR